MAVVMHLRGRASAPDARRAVMVGLRWVFLVVGRAAAPDALEAVVVILRWVVSLGGRAAARPYYI